MADKKSRFDQAEYIRSYTKDHITRVSVVLNRQYDSDLIDHLSKVQSKSAYIKKLIRNDMKSDPKA